MLRPTAAGDIADAIEDTPQIWIYLYVPLAIVLTLLMVCGAGSDAVSHRHRAALSRGWLESGGKPSARHQQPAPHHPLAFALSGLLTGVGGMLLAGQVGIGSPSTGTDYTLMSITVVVLGGASVAGGRGSFSPDGVPRCSATSSASSFIDANSSVHYAVIGT